MGQDILPRENTLSKAGHWVGSKVIEERINFSVVKGRVRGCYKENTESGKTSSCLSRRASNLILYFPVLSVWCPSRIEFVSGSEPEPEKK
jgi:hypothetical protein